MTKKIIACVAVAMMTTLSVNAQAFENKHEISISYGQLANSDWMNIFEDILTVPFQGAKRENETYYGPIGVEYLYRLDKTVSVGGLAVYGHRGYDLYEKDVNRGKMTNDYITLMPAVKFTWKNGSYYGVYSKLAAGVTYRMEKSDDIDYDEKHLHFNWQVTLLGAEFGSSRFRGFVDLGFGEQGVLSAGLRYKF